jgi:hypothetical protein
MTPRQAARSHCANYQADGSCLGVGLRDDLSLYRFRKEGLPCVFLHERGCEGCLFFEETVLPQVPPSVAEEYRNSLPTSVATSVQPQRLATKLCLDCHKREVRPRQKYCAVCAKVRKRAANRNHITRKRRRDVGKLVNSPTGAEALTKPEKQVGYPHPEKTATSGSVFSTQQAIAQDASDSNGSINTAEGIAS